MKKDDWNNSAFAYCLLHVLREGVADLNVDGKIVISGLQQYLSKTVPQLTNNVQQPTYRVKNISNDWRV